MNLLDGIYAEVSNVAALENDPAKELTQSERTIVMRYDAFLRYVLSNYGKEGDVPAFTTEFNF